MLFCCFEEFLGISQKTSLFCQKFDYLRKKLTNNQKVCFLNKFEKVHIQKKIRNFFKQPFLFKGEKLAKYKQKLFFSSK